MRLFYTLSVVLLWSMNVLMAQCPSLCFSVDQTNGCATHTVTFTHTSSNPNAYYIVWNFNDGSPTYTMTVPTATVSHSYTAANTYSPYIEVFDNTWSSLGISYGNSGDIYVNGIGINGPSVLCPGDEDSFCPSFGMGSTSWNFGDGGTSTDYCPSHSYSSAGTYTVSLIGNSGGCPTQTVTHTVNVNGTTAPPNNWWFNPNPAACPNENVNFSTHASNTYSWTFGDGSNSTMRDPFHSYTATGTYSVTLTKTNGCSLSSSNTQTILVSNNVKFPNESWFKLEPMPSPACPNATVGFNAPGGYSSYEWNFGDGSPLSNSSDNYNQHTYGSTLTTYTASVKITNACNNDTTIYATVTIQNNVGFPNQSWFRLEAQSPACPNSNVELRAPGNYQSYEWNFGDGSPVVITNDDYARHNYGSTLTTYTASVKITNGCNKDTTMYAVVDIQNNVGFPQSSWFNLHTTSPTCVNDAAWFNGPGGYINYQWDFGDGQTAITTREYASHTYSATGTYTVALQLSNTCGKDTTIYTSIVLDNAGIFPSWIQIESSPEQGSCPNDIMTFGLQAGNAFASYNWDFGDGSTIITTTDEVQHTYTAVGTYTLSCEITNGCGVKTTLTKLILISNSSPISNSFSVFPLQSPSCPTDVVSFNPQDGQPSYSYFWDFGDGSLDTTIGQGATHTYTALGTYSVQVIALNSCGLSKTVTLTHSVTSTAVPVLDNGAGEAYWGYPGSEGGGSAYAGCAGDAILFYFMGSAANNLYNFGDGNTGTATEIIMVNGGDGGEPIPVTVTKHAYAANGTYTVTLTLTNGCGNSVTDTLILNIGGNLQVNGEMTSSPPPFTTCAPITLIAFGGSNYNWDFGDGSGLNSSNPTVSHTYASAGSYNVSVIITNGCGNTAQYSMPINITGVGGPAVTLNSSADPTCLGGSNGTASVNVSNGQMPYTYAWGTTGQTTSAASGLSSGLYYVTVTDHIGCSNTFGVNISDPAPIVLTPSATNASCGGSDGTAAVAVTSGAQAPYTYNWAVGGQTTSSISGLIWGNYQVTVTDANGCSATAQALVSEANAAAISTNTITTVTCFGSSTGAIDINVSGGLAPYTYMWSNGGTTQDITGLSAGAYSVTVTDNNMCMSVYNVSVSQNAVINTNTSVQQNPTCGNFDGKAKATPTGGTGPYTYLWDSNAANQTTQTATGLPAGAYSVTITDALGCTKVGTISLNNSNSPLVTAQITNATCNGGTNGSINVTVTGGTSPYLYTWNLPPPQTNYQDVTGLAAGNYFVTVQDAAGCISFQLFNVDEPAILSASVSAVGATCGNNDGQATAVPAGGTSPYTYSWTGGQTGVTATGLALGSYTVNVTDANGCTTSSTTSISATALPISICGITVDNSSTKNEIVWEKPAVSNIDSFRVYRFINSVYTWIGSVAYADSSRFVDTTNGVNPNTTSYKYKVGVLDNCGLESALSDFHQTIHLQVGVAAPPNSFNLQWTDYLGYPVTQYYIMVDTLKNGSWFKRDSVSFGNPLTWTDNKSYMDTVSYMIQIAHPTGCAISGKGFDPMASNLNLSKSNVNRVADSTVVGIGTNLHGKMEVVMYPNPTSGELNLILSADYKNVTVQLFNLVGEKVADYRLDRSLKEERINLNHLPQGVYFVEFKSGQEKIVKKLMIK